MAQLYRIAEAHGCSRVEWTTDSENEVAQRCCESLGLRQYAGKVLYRVDRMG